MFVVAVFVVAVLWLPGCGCRAVVEVDWDAWDRRRDAGESEE